MCIQYTFKGEVSMSTEKNEKDVIKKDSYSRFNITMSEEDIKNFEKLKKSLPAKTKSGMFRYFLETAINNPQAFVSLNTPESTTDKSIDELLKLLPQVTAKENTKLEKRLSDLEIQNQEMLKLLERIHAILADKFPEETKKIRKELNGLGGKI